MGALGLEKKVDHEENKIINVHIAKKIEQTFLLLALLKKNCIHNPCY